jgi:hypothetical protein
MTNPMIITNELELISYLQKAKGSEPAFAYKKGQRESFLQLVQVAGDAIVLHHDSFGRAMASDISTAVSRAVPHAKIKDFSGEERLQAFHHAGGEYHFSAKNYTLENAQERFNDFLNKKKASAEVSGIAVKKKKSLFGLSGLFESKKSATTEAGDLAQHNPPRRRS